METGTMKLALSAGALALSMALAGCGGSSSGGTPPGGDPKCEPPQTGTYPDCTDPPPPSRSDVDNMESERWATAIGDPDGLPNAFGNPDDFTVTRIRGAAEIELADTAASDFEAGPAVSITGGIGQAFTKESDEADGDDEKIVVFTNREEVGELDWLGSAAGDLESLSSTDVDDVGQVTITAAALPAVYNVDLGNLLESGRSSRALTANDPVSGSLFGVSGRFHCTAVCTITRNETTGIITVGDSPLIFTPGTSEIADLKAKYANLDNAYAIFG